MSAARPPAMFLADALALDFLNSIGFPVDAEVEWLSSGQDLVNWLKEAALVDPQTLAQIAASAGPGELDAVAAQARALREWFRAFVRQHKGARLSRKAVKDLEPLNRLLARDEEFGQVQVREKQSGKSTGPSDFVWVPQRRWRSADALLLPIAKSMAELLANANFASIKACEGPTCTLLFLDTTRGQVRRWCSMSICGNRAKQAAHRLRTNSAKA